MFNINDIPAVTIVIGQKNKYFQEYSACVFAGVGFLN
jgi:hypothetical protein